MVKLNIDADSPNGFMVINRARIAGGSGDLSPLVINVATQPKPASLTAKAASTTVAATDVNDGGLNQTTITATVKNDQSPAVGMAGQRLTFITTLGLLDCDGVGSGNAAAQVCLADTIVEDNDPETTVLGTATVTLIGASREGTATISITHASLDPTSVDVTLFGSAKNLAAAAEQGSVEVDGTAFIVLTVTDGAGNPVSGVQPAAAAEKPIVGPEGGNPVDTMYNVNKVDSNGKVVIPACMAHEAEGADPDADPPVLATAGSKGTDDDGQCVVQVKALDLDGTDDDSTRGVNTLSFQLASVTPALKASAEIEVAGVAASIETDAPESVEPLSSTKIMVTVKDDEGVLVGQTGFDVEQFEGGGLIRDASAMTADGVGSFTLLAPSSAGAVSVLITAGKHTEIVTIQVGEAMPEEPDMPAMPDGAATLTVQGNIGSFSGGSLDAFAAAAAAECPGGSQIAVQDADGEWNLWSSTAPAFAIIGFTTTFADGFDGMTFVWVSSCEADAMDSEGSMGSEG